MPSQAADWMPCRLLCCGNTNSTSAVEWEAGEHRLDAKSEGNDGRRQKKHCASPEAPAGDKTSREKMNVGKIISSGAALIRFYEGKTI